MDGSLGALEFAAFARFPQLNGAANTRDLGWPDKISDLQDKPRRDQNFSGRRPGDKFGILRLPETG